MDLFLKELSVIRDFSANFTEFEVAFVLCLSFSLALVIASVYNITHKGLAYSQSFVHTMIIITVVVALIMLIIGSNIARAFTLVGALSIVRFRNAVKETRDVGFIFLSMAIGMACGTRFYFLAAFSTVLISIFMLMLYKLDLFSKVMKEKLLIIRTPHAESPEENFRECLEEYFRESRLISMESAPVEGMMEIVYSVVLKKGKTQSDIFKAISAVNDGNRIVLLDGQQQMDI